MQRLKEQRKSAPHEEIIRMVVEIEGYVQGVGFRPFVYRLAAGLNLKGWVSNSKKGVLIEVEGRERDLQDFLVYLENDKPPLSYLSCIGHSFLKPSGYTEFSIKPSVSSFENRAQILPDISTCRDCLEEIFNPGNRRYQYPFTNCTNCGPRFTIILALPYDRDNTTMGEFNMCAACRSEYENPADRRFHAETNCCSECGPQIELLDSQSKILSSGYESILKLSDYIRRGNIAAVKGIGGFHLITDARAEDSVKRLRLLKNREKKPFALMYPNVQHVKENCELSWPEEKLLTSARSPIVLLRRKPSDIAPSVSPDNPYLGVMLPYAPLYHILMAELGFPVVATSGNISDEPICKDEQEAVSKLNGIADYFLVHNRRIANHADDSLACIVMDRVQLRRSGRGYAPISLKLSGHNTPSLSVGGQLKNTAAVSSGEQVTLSQHIGNLDSYETVSSFEKVIDDLKTFYDIKPQLIACDAHPDYYTTAYAEKQNLPILHVQHHYAHVLACKEEHNIKAPALGISWDGSGYGTDGTVWGGEFLRITSDSFERVAHLRPFPLPGGEKAVIEPRRTALGLIYEVFKENVLDMDYLPPFKTFSEGEIKILLSMVQKELNCPITSSAGRLFDAVSSILGLCQYNSFEAEASMKLEFSIGNTETKSSYEYSILERKENGITIYMVDWEPLVKAILDDINLNTLLGTISAKFHNTLVDTIISIAGFVGEENVVLSGGCFQNRFLLELAVNRLRGEGFSPFWAERIPPNDEGIALGQMVAASRISKGGKEKCV